MYALLLISVAISITNVQAYGTGASTAACSTMVPDHGAAAQSVSSNPYVLKLSAERLVSGNLLTLTLEKKVNTTEDFNGFMVQAKDERDGKLLGEFISMGGTSKFMSCDDDMPKATLSHSSNSTKIEATFKWKTTAFKNGGDKTVRFEYAIVQTKNKFWTSQVAESKLHLMEDSLAPTPQPNGTSADKCFAGKGCFGLPADCEAKSDNGASCKGLFKYSLNKEQNMFFDFELHSTANDADSYHAVGFSNNAFMGDDLVIACLADRVSFHWTTVTPSKGANLLFSLNASSEIEHSVETLEGGRRICKIRYTAKTTVQVPPATAGGSASDQTFDFSSDSQYLLMATGKAIDGQLTYHLDSKIVTKAKVDLMSVKDHSGRNDKNGGASEMAAKMGLVVMGVLMVLKY